MQFYLQTKVNNTIIKKTKTKKGKTSIINQIKYEYIIHEINHASIFKKDYYEKGVGLSTKILTRLFGKGTIVKQVLDDLQKWKFIIKVQESKYKKTSAKYKLHDSIIDLKIRIQDYDENDSVLIKKLELRNAENKKSYQGQLEILKKFVMINEKGKNHLINKYGCLPYRNNKIDVFRRDCCLISILNSKFFSVRPHITSRVYSSFTSLCRDHRNYIQIDGKPMIMTDISNSQILLTVPLIHNYWNKIQNLNITDIPQDVIKFQKLAETGHFYEHMAKSIGEIFTNEEDRKEFKKRVFSEIWFSENSRYMTLIKKAFVEEFPTIYHIIWQLKLEDHCNFAISLQKFEASIMVDKVWKQMYDQGKIVLTLHDAIICNNYEDLELAKTLIRSELLKFGLNPHFKDEECSDHLITTSKNKVKEPVLC